MLTIYTSYNILHYHFLFVEHFSLPRWYFSLIFIISHLHFSLMVSFLTFILHFSLMLGYFSLFFFSASESLARIFYISHLCSDISHLCFSFFTYISHFWCHFSLLFYISHLCWDISHFYFWCFWHLSLILYIDMSI